MALKAPRTSLTTASVGPTFSEEMRSPGVVAYHLPPRRRILSSQARPERGPANPTPAGDRLAVGIPMPDSPCTACALDDSELSRQRGVDYRNARIAQRANCASHLGPRETPPHRPTR
jgi:hypothetical protein